MVAGDTNGDDTAPEAVPVHAITADIGLGKTRAWREHVAAVLVAAGKHQVLAVPRHRLGDEIVRDLVAAGLSARVYRGREARDPDEPGDVKMCRDFGRAELITAALGSVSSQACRHRGRECEFFNVCGYQAQQRQAPDVWVVPHQILFRPRPRFIPPPAALAIDESFWSAALHGVDRPVKIWLSDLIDDRHIRRDPGGTADLIAFSTAMHAALRREASGRIRSTALIDGRITSGDLRAARGLEWKRKLEVEAYPGMALANLRAACARVAMHNQMVARLARFWELALRTIEASDERSPWLELRNDEPSPNRDGVEPAIRMAWREDIHHDWQAPTLVMDATMPIEIVRQFFPGMEQPCQVSAPMPYTRVRQIADRPMTASMLIASEGAAERTNATRQANVERVRRFIEVRADDVRPGRVLVVCQQGLETGLLGGPLPPNVETRHFNDIAGENAWSDVALVIVIGRTEPAPRTVERTARALFGADVLEIVPDDQGAIRYPLARCGIRLRDGSAVGVEGPMHPDPRVEAVRRAICEAGLTQAIGRGRGVNRTAANPLQIDILTNVVLPIEVDTLMTWERIQPARADIMRARGAVPLSYADMAAAYPDLFESRDAAKMALKRENPEQMPIEDRLIGVCSGFSTILYRRAGARGPATTLLYDPGRIDPATWLVAHLGTATVLP